MNLLVPINGNADEWQACYTASVERPRLPLPYAFGAACTGRGFILDAADFSPRSGLTKGIRPFREVFDLSKLGRALRKVDLAAFWGMFGAKNCLRQALRPSHRRQVVFLVYGWKQLYGRPTFHRRTNLFAIRFAARFARCVVVMTREQMEAARSSLPSSVDVIQLRVGVDVQFYSHRATLQDVQQPYREAVEQLLQEPYVIMPGDELRLNDDALDIVERTGLRLVRISQYAGKSGTSEFKAKIERKGLGERIIVFERISYQLLRFLFQHASAYAGFVDATWQPAGWTVACESLSSGTPVVLYEGLVSRELETLGIGTDIARVVPMGDRQTFGEALRFFSRTPERDKLRAAASEFAARHLDLEITGKDFAEKLALLLDGGS